MKFFAINQPPHETWVPLSYKLSSMNWNKTNSTELSSQQNSWNIRLQNLRSILERLQMPKSQLLCIQKFSLLSLNELLDSWIILTVFKSTKYPRIYRNKNIKALHIQARTTTYSELDFSSFLLYCSLTVGDRTFFKVTGVAK